MKIEGLTSAIESTELGKVHISSPHINPEATIQKPLLLQKLQHLQRQISDILTAMAYGQRSIA